MSAIFGIIDFAGRKVEDKWVRSMQDDLAHRGPDGQGLFREESVALGHMLLHVTPESVYDNSPYEEDGFVITANARLDERDGIMDRLGIEAAERETITDPLLLLRSFRKFGKDFVKDIYGDFSFAIWDKAKKELFCARDQMGVKPFLYYHDDNRFVFSTEMKSIVRLPFVSTSPDHHLLQTSAFGLAHEPDKTAWENICRLHAAHTVTLQNKSAKFTHYWIPKYQESKLYRYEEACVVALRQLVTRVIADHTRTLKPVGVPLSGGLDSSTIACFAARRMRPLNRNLYTVSSVVHPEQREKIPGDEFRYIQAVVEQEGNIEGDYVYNTDLDLIKDLNKKFDSQYRPVNYFHYLDDATYSQLRSKSVRRVLSGLIGDETISSRFVTPLPYLLLTGKIFRYLKFSLKLSKREGLSFTKFIRTHTLNPLLRLLFHNNSQIFYERFSGWNSGILPINKDYLASRTVRKKRINLLYTLRQRNVVTDTIWAPDYEFFNEEFDCSASHHCLELTYPFADRRIVEFLMSIPVEHFWAGFQNRGLIRRVTEGIVPDLVRNRSDKQAYSPDFYGIFSRSAGDLKEILRNHVIRSDPKFLFDFSKMIILLENLEKQGKEITFDAKYWIVNNLSILSLYYIWLFNKLKIENENQKD